MSTSVLFMSMSLDGFPPLIDGGLASVSYPFALAPAAGTARTTSRFMGGTLLPW
jgi:hypothetical protein